ncbi:MAG: hypothetical protein JRI80_20155 [Deltaproteobacteria bacterium]|nr:hypothetical protein [Deltaproteobacteria bacterium]
MRINADDYSSVGAHGDAPKNKVRNHKDHEEATDILQHEGTKKKQGTTDFTDYTDFVGAHGCAPKNRSKDLSTKGPQALGTKGHKEEAKASTAFSPGR